MCVLKVYSLFYALGVSYLGANFSDINKEGGMLSVFSELSPYIMRPYAIHTHAFCAGRSMTPVIRENSYSLGDICEMMLDGLQGGLGKGFYVQTLIEINVDVELKHSSSIGNLSEEKTSVIYDDFEEYSLAWGNYTVLNKEIFLAEDLSGKKLSPIFICNSNIFNIKKVYSSACICTKDKCVFFSQLYASMEADKPTEVFRYVDIIGNNKCLKNLEYIDGVLLAQAFGCNVKTSYVRFMSAWIVLEKFINKFYSSLDKFEVKRISNCCSDLLNDRTKSYLSEIQNNESEQFDPVKFSLVDKFIVCCKKLKTKNLSNIVLLLKKIKRDRDKLHLRVGESGEYPIAQLMEILKILCSDSGGYDC